MSHAVTQKLYGECPYSTGFRRWLPEGAVHSLPMTYVTSLSDVRNYCVSLHQQRQALCLTPGPVLFRPQASSTPYSAPWPDEPRPSANRAAVSDMRRWMDQAWPARSYSSRPRTPLQCRQL